MPTFSHQAYSCLIAGDAYEPVCDGYAKAVKMVCDLLKSPAPWRPATPTCGTTLRWMMGTGTTWI